MSTGMPELGSKISLISKADIRYEGRLFTVDPQECTIALASVRSFGTEDRETQYPVPAQNQVYDYILFRGSDIKDIRVINSVQSLPNDPAIMQLSAPPSLGQQFQPQSFSHPVLGAMGPQMAQFSAGYGMGAIGGLASGLAPGMGMGRDPRGLHSKQPSELIMQGPVPPTDLSSAVEPPRLNDHASVLDLIGGGSRSTTPASLGSKSPTAERGVQISGGVRKDDKKTVRPIQPPVQRNQHQQRERKDSRGDNLQDPRNQNRSIPNRAQPNQSQQMYQGQRQGGWIPRGQPRQRGRPRGAPGNYRTNQPNQQGGSKPKSTLKFDNDYDFEQANTQFEELRSQLEKVKIKDAKPEVNGDCEKKDDSGNETGAGENEQEEEEQIFYDRAKSFFDNISCEAVERSKGRSQRTDWRAERKLNSETFGVASTRRNNYRGRGGYYNRGGFRGGYRGGYRNNQNQMNRRGPQQENRTSQNQSQPATAAGASSSQQPPAPVPATSNK